MENPKIPSLSRRHFSQLSAAASVAILTGAGRSARAEANSETLKVGLIGCGGRGTGAAENMLESDNNVQLVALADLFKDKVDGTRKQLTENPKAQVRGKVAINDDHCFVGLDAIKKICESEIDILLIGTVPYGKPEQLEIATAHKKHVFIEKPVAVDPVGIRRFLAACEKHKAAGLSLVAGTQRRHQKEYVETIDKIHNGEIGDVIALRAYWCDNLPWVRDRKEGASDFEYRIRNWLNYCWCSGDNIVEQHVHNLDVCNWVMNGHPTSVFSSGGRTWKPTTEKYGDLFDHFSCDFEYAGGVHLQSECRHWDGCAGGVFEQASGSKGRSACNDRGAKGLNPYVQEHIDLIGSITGKGKKYHEGVQVAESTMTAIMGRMSAYTGKKLTWDEALNADLSIVPEKLDFEVKIPVWSVPNPINMKIIR